jgi:hypothetical protein
MAPKPSRRGRPKRYPAPDPASIPRPAANAADRAAEAQELSSIMTDPTWNDPEAKTARQTRNLAFLGMVGASIRRERARDTSPPPTLSRAETMAAEVLQARWESRLKELNGE